LNSKVRFNEILAPLTSWHVGGPADQYFRPDTIEELKVFLASLPPNEPLTWLGLGSNVLIHDNGIRGTVIHLLQAGQPSFDTTKNNQDEEKIVRVTAGIPCAKLAKFCAKHGLAEGAFFAGIPGTIGGALAMNAGAFGGETWKYVEKVEVIDHQGNLSFRTPKDYCLSYRTAIGPENEWFVAGLFRFKVGSTEKVSKEIKDLLHKRNESQPIGKFSCGSVFKNPPNDFAGRLIEASGLKGFQIGDAQISEKHGNFIINHGHATAKDMLALIHYIQEKIWTDHQVRLETEVRMLGF